MDGFADLSTVFLYFRNLSEALFQTERASRCRQGLAKGLFSKPIKCVDGETLGGIKTVTIQ